jgi:CheY-like chemotaxis protein
MRVEARRPRGRSAPTPEIVTVKYRIPLFAALVLCVGGLASLRGQDSEFYKKPTNPKEFWRAMQFEIGVGKFDIAAAHLKGLLESNPSEKDLLEIEAKDGLVSFLRLRNVERWFFDKQADADARQNVEKLITLVSDALKKELSDPDRIMKYARRLTAETPEEIAFAQKELLRSGVSAVPLLLDLLRGNAAPALRAAILDLLPRFGAGSVPPLVAALDVDEPNLKIDLLNVLRQRDDYLTLRYRAETDIIPTLWYFSAPLPIHPEGLRTKARGMLKGLLEKDPDSERNTERRTPQYRLTEEARTFLEHKERFTNPEKVNVWRWEGARPVAAEMTPSEAEEYYGLRYARWALRAQPDYLPAQKVFLTLALDKHFARSPADMPLAKSSPELYAILVTAPYDFVTDLLETALREKRISQAVALLHVLGDRTEVKAARSSEASGGDAPKPEARPSLLMKALDYPDRRVQFAAVDALLRTPGPHLHQRAAQIVKILAGYLQADPPEPGAKPRAAIGDTDRVRGEALAGVLRQAGFDAVVLRTGKDLVRRIQQRPDVDLILVDHHIAGPMLPDVLTQLRADFRAKTVPLLVVASPEKAPTAHPLTLLGRVAALAAAEEHLTYVYDQRRDYDVRREAPSARLRVRGDIIRKHIEAAGIVISADVLDRLEYLLYLTTPVNELGIDIELERTKLILSPVDRLNRMAALRDDERRGRVRADEPPFANTRELTPRLAEEVARYEAGLKQEVLNLADVYWAILQNGQVDAAGKYLQPPLPAVSLRYPELEAKLRRLTLGYPKTRVIPELFSAFALKEQLTDLLALDDPKLLEAEKRHNARVALEWLRKMATGELPGYPVALAEPALRQAMQSKDLAPLAVDAVSRLPGRDAQQDLAGVVLSGADPDVRLQAADALIRHIQQRGMMLSDPQKMLVLDRAGTEQDAPVRNRLLALKGIMASSSRETGARLLGFTPSAPAAPKEEPKEEPKEKKDEPKDKKD